MPSAAAPLIHGALQRGYVHSLSIRPGFHLLFNLDGDVTVFVGIVQVRRTRISDRMRKLQDLVPNMDKVSPNSSF